MCQLNVIDDNELIGNNQLMSISCFQTDYQLSLSFNISSHDSLSTTTVNIFLEKQCWRQRIWLGIKYMFGYKCKVLKDVILNKSDLQNIISFIEEECMTIKSKSYLH